MNTNQLKRFATDARVKLRKGVQKKISTLGFDDNGQVREGLTPRKMSGGTLWNEKIYPESFFDQWMALQAAIEREGLNQVVEEVAYTWFNRLMAIRILAMNGLSEPVLRFVDESRTPRLVDDARMGRIPEMPEEQRHRLMELMQDDTALTDQFAVLLVAFCHNTPILRECFGTVNDYTEILLPDNILQEDQFVDMLNKADFINEEDYRSAELIGWLYQFYISDRKDEVFAKKGKVEADEIPAATQIFTPNWIVKYMVENAILPQVRSNRIDPEFKKYLVNPDDVPDEPKKPRDLKVADLACGSGHILNECFDLLYELYVKSGYNREDAIENIFRHNLLGIDIDTRARQLSTFALMLKACQRDETFADAHCLPRVLSMPNLDERLERRDERLAEFFANQWTPAQAEEIEACFDLMKDADSLGSIMKFEISPSTRHLIATTLDYWRSQSVRPDAVTALFPSFDLILALTDSYDAIVMNPPYMGIGNANDVLASYAKKNYPDTKADLFSVFMDVCYDRLVDGGRYGMINMQSWMFLSSFAALREKVLKEQTISSMLHLGPRTFDELSGEVVQNTAFVIEKTEPTATTSATYHRLIEGKNCADKESMFLACKNSYENIAQSNFEKIPGSPIGYWVSMNMICCFNSDTIYPITISDGQTKTGDNAKYLREFWEVSKKSFGRGKKWIFYAKGGEFRRWYGNLTTSINWSEEARNFYRKDKIARILPEYLWYKKGITWNYISSNTPGFRLLPEDAIFDVGGSSIFFKDESQLYPILGFLNSHLAIKLLRLYNPTINNQVNDIRSLPQRNDYFSDNIKQKVRQNVSISKQDWDAHETSWDFQTNELASSLSYDEWSDVNHEYTQFFKIKFELPEFNPNDLRQRMSIHYFKWIMNFLQLHENEEELNRQFIDIYGLQDELTPDVPLDEVTILQQGEISIKQPDDKTSVENLDKNDPFYKFEVRRAYEDRVEWHDDVIIKQLMSYMVGVWMGRYRLDRPGLNIAHPNPTDEELASYHYGPDGETVVIDDDAIIPILPTDAPFEDNLANRINDFVRIAWGAESQVQNLNFIEQCLGKSISDYVQKDFWKDHKRTYQNRPIYWLWSSKRGAFKCLTYAHRMTRHTAAKLRTDYLLPYTEHLRQQIEGLEARAAALNAAERRRLDQLRAALTDCEEYDLRLAVVADRSIAFDLDAGIPANHALFGSVLTKLK